MNTTMIIYNPPPYLQPTNNSEEFNLFACLSSVSVTMSAVVTMMDYTFGLPANAWSLWLISSSGRSSIESEIFTLNLVSMEMACTLLFVITTVNIFRLHNPSLDNKCNFLFGLAFAFRPLFQCCICVERYLAVVHPVIYLKYKPLRYRMRCCVVVWLLVLGFGVIRTINVSMIDNLCLFLPILSVDLFCSLSILRVLKKPGPGDGGKEEVNLKKKRAFRIVSIILVMLVVNYGPTIIMAPIEYMFSQKVIVCEIDPLIATISLLGSSIQALLFLHRAGKLSLCAGRNMRETAGVESK